MKYLLLALGFIATSAQADVKYLHYKYNENVIITISNVPCPIIGVKQQYDWAAIASRSDGQKLIGCYKKENENDIKIQWYRGDTTILPANYFLVDPEKGVPVKPTL